jgi:coatomer protein complex subunit gamma
VNNNPAKYIRFIYNRVILENATVRAAAISTLARFAVSVEGLKPRIKILLRRCLEDADDEVRDRATFFLRVLDDPQLQSEYLADETVYTWSVLEQSLLSYLADPASHSSPFNIQSVPVLSKAQELSELSRAKSIQAVAPPPILGQAPGGSKTSASSAAQQGGMGVDASSVHAQTFASNPALAVLGPIFKSSNPVELTEAETEYVLVCVKHVLTSHVVFQVCYYSRIFQNDFPLIFRSPKKSLLARIH